LDELLLWRWSTAVQITSALLIAAFFVAYNRNLDHPALRLWSAAWVANGVALFITWVYWFVQPDMYWAQQLALGSYFASKSAFVLLVVVGVRTFIHGAQGLLRPEPAALAFAGCGLLGALLLRGIDPLGVVQATLIAAAFGYGAWLCWRHPGQGLGWLGFGLFLRSLLGLAEAASYGSRLVLDEGARPAVVDLFLAAHSSFDTGAEWVIALGCVLALGQRMLAELSASHRELHAAHAELTRVAERDALTGLHNRRMLSRLVEAPAMAGGRLLFFDLDDFKRINDAHGHEVGDASLRRFAEALAAAFPEAGGLVRFAGDEFVVLLPADAGVDVAARCARLRSTLADGHAQPAIGFSVGIATTTRGGDLRDLLHAADLDMYRDKRERDRSPRPT
jgi:diguanylate cyclase (GGDEF)-like protein